MSPNEITGIRNKLKNKSMRNREATLRKLDSVDSNLNKLITYLNQGNRDNCYETVENLREQIDQIRGYIESEPIAGAELNTSIPR